MPILIPLIYPAVTIATRWRRKVRIVAPSQVMSEIKIVCEEHPHRYGYLRITLELRWRGWLVNHKKVQRLMSKLKLFGIISKRWCKYNSYRGTQGSIMIKRNFSAVYP